MTTFTDASIQATRGTGDAIRLTGSLNPPASHLRPLALVSSAALLVMVGCANSGQQTLPAPTVPDRFAQTANRDTAFEGAWWERFGDPALASLVKKALVANHDVRIATERVRQARASTVAAQSHLWPSFGLGSSINKQLSGMPEQVKQAGVPDARLSRLDVDTSWEIDIFGGVRAAAQGAAKDANATEYSQAATRLLVASEVARQYFVLKGASERLQIVERLAQTQRDTERLTRSRQREGIASEFDVNRASGERSNTESQIPPLKILQATSRQRIAVLLAATSVADVAELAADETGAVTWPVIPAVSPGQPSELLQRRPDLLAVQQSLDAEGDRLREAKSNRWPKVFLNALWGREDYEINSNHFSPVRFSAVGLAFQMPIFTAGRVQAGIEAQSSRQQAAWLTYQKSVLTAVEDVEDSLVSLNQEKLRLASLNEATTAEKSAQAHADSLYREGQIDLLQLLDVQRNVLASELAESESRTQQALDAVLLYKALGGGWISKTEKGVVVGDASASRP